MPLKSTKRTLRRCMHKLVREKKLDHITIAEICEAAGIGRRTFYRYYTDKYVLFEDMYIHYYFNKLELDENSGLYDIYSGLIRQMYDEKELFSHTIKSKGQNGFWELLTKLIYPKINATLTSDPKIDEMKGFYIRRDIEISLHLIELWINRGYDWSPDEMCEYIRFCNAIHGKWEYQLAMKRPPDPYSFDSFKKDEW
ncbi:MAG: TetR/AcrR family transcriptional regulator [Clostridia bacterium]|nr:TetR/AcrR family transcriptional regulator [Clostridia bacterium]